MQKITEKRILAVSQQSLLANGGTRGEIKVSDTSLFRVGQIVTLSSDTVGYAQFQVKRILKQDTIFLGNPDDPIHSRSDVSAYTAADNAVMFAREQKRPPVPEQEIERHTYEEEPVVARRVVLVDKYGERVSDANPLPVYYTDGSTPVIYTEHATFTDTSETTVGIFTASSNDSRMFRLLGDAKTFGTWRMYRTSIGDANLFAVGRTSPMHGICDIKLEQAEVFNNNGVVVITFQAERYRSNLLTASAKTFIRLEGFIKS